MILKAVLLIASFSESHEKRIEIEIAFGSQSPGLIESHEKRIEMERLSEYLLTSFV